MIDHVFDINDAVDVKEIDVEVPGWYPLRIRYGLFKISEKNYLLWNVVGSKHTFGVSLRLITREHSGNYKEHFILTLKKFREDLYSWIEEGLPEDWMKSYYNQFKGLLN